MFAEKIGEDFEKLIKLMSRGNEGSKEKLHEIFRQALK